MKASQQKQGVKRGRYGKALVRRNYGGYFALPGPVRALNAERKCLDINNAGNPPRITVISTTFTTDLLNLIQPGPESYNRIGRRVQMHSVRVHGKIAATAHAAADDYGRILVVYDRQAKQAAPVVADVFEGISDAGAVSNTAWDDLAVGSFGRFDVLADIRIDWSGLTSATNASSGAITDYKKNEVNIDRFIRLKGLTANYATGSNIPESGSLYLLTLGTIAGATAPMQFEWTARLRYTA